MILLLDTHVLLWSVREPERLSWLTQSQLNAPENELVFSVVSIWEVSIKNGARDDFNVDPALLRQTLLYDGFTEIGVNGVHAITVKHLPPIHKDPFDRMLVAQSIVEGFTLLTSDARVLAYGGAIRKA